MLIMLYVHHETSYDKFNENYDRIYVLEKGTFRTLPAGITPLLKENIPEVEEY